MLDATALISAVIGTAGLVGLALGFALRDVVENYIAGLLLSLRQPFAPADHVVIDGHEGKVAALTIRSTNLITLDGNHLRLPNALVFKGVILNYTRNPQRRFGFRVGIGTREDIVRARRIGIEALRSLPGVLPEPPPLALVTELAESSVTIEFSAWFDQREAGYFRLRSEAIRLVKDALDAGESICQNRLTGCSWLRPRVLPLEGRASRPPPWTSGLWRMRLTRRSRRSSREPQVPISSNPMRPGSEARAPQRCFQISALVLTFEV
nr:mechanosensitive ion channel family protein [Aquabacterium fontiphilum]